MWPGEIVDLQHRTSPSESWWVQIETSAGVLYSECTTQEIWETLNLGDQYTINVNNVPCP